MKKSFNRLLALTLTLFLILPNAVFLTGAVENDTAKKDSSEQVVHCFPSGTDRVILRDENGNAISTSAHLRSENQAVASLPASYDLRNQNRVTSVKEQSPYGTCWAHAAIASIESHLITAGQGTASSLDLSEDHLIYFTGKMETNLGDGIKSASHKDYAYDSGGTWEKVSATLVNWWGVEKEENAPYPTGNYAESKRVSSAYRLKEVRLLADKHDDLLSNINEIKTEVMNGGAVEVSYYDDDAYRRSHSDPTYYFTSSTYDDSTNHSVAIIGWDDNYAKTNFRYQPPRNGAFLIKNSWGTDCFDNGYMWISYYDISLSEAVVYDCDPVSDYEYDHIYGYNGFGIHDWSWSDKKTMLQYANTFVSAESEILEAVGLWTMQDNLDYTIQIYRGLSSSATNPTKGTLVSACTTTGNVLRHGYRTVKLQSGCLLNAGERYAVVVTIKAKSHNFIVYPFEGDGGTYTYYRYTSANNYVSENKTIVYSSKRGESYIYDSSQWKDIKDYTSSNFNNAFLNVYTKSVPTKKCGDNVYWSFDSSTGTLNITGTGEMWKYASDETPWYSCRANIKAIVIGNGVTNIGERVFWDCMNLTGVTIPDSVTSIDYAAFYKCASLKQVTIPISVKTIGEYAFSTCTSLSDVYYSGTQAEWDAIDIKAHNASLLNATLHVKSTQPDNPATCTLALSPTSLTIPKGGSGTVKCSYTLSGDYSSIKAINCSFEIVDGIATGKFGNWEKNNYGNDTIPLTIYGQSVGATKVNIAIKNRDTGEILAKETLSLTVEDDSAEDVSLWDLFWDFILFLLSPFILVFDLLFGWLF